MNFYTIACNGSAIFAFRLNLKLGGKNGFKTSKNGVEMQLNEIIESEELHLKHLNDLVSEAIREEKLLTTKLAELEMDYWVVHRRLAIARAQNPNTGDIEPMVQSLANLHAALFATTPAQMRPSAELRARAAETVDLITSKRSTDVPGDWRKVEAYLQQAYRAVRQSAD